MGKMLFEMLVCHLPRLPASYIKQPFLSHHHLPLEYGFLRSQPPNLSLELVLCPVTKGYNCFKNSPPMLTNFFRCHINTLLLEIDGLSKKKKKKTSFTGEKKKCSVSICISYTWESWSLPGHPRLCAPSFRTCASIQSSIRTMERA